MKNTLISALTALRRSWLLYQIRSLEITADGITECLLTVRDPLLRRRMEISRDANRRELTRLRADYTATLKPGRRV
ncbi:MAG: hypothetical protein ACKO0Z_09895, partial [Betaproteobacteria bacterium]